MSARLASHLCHLLPPANNRLQSERGRGGAREREERERERERENERERTRERERETHTHAQNERERDNERAGQAAGAGRGERRTVGLGGFVGRGAAEEALDVVGVELERLGAVLDARVPVLELVRAHRLRHTHRRRRQGEAQKKDRKGALD